MNATGYPESVEFYNSVQGAAFLQRLLREWEAEGIITTFRWTISERAYRESRGVFGRLVLRWRMYPGYAWVCWRGGRQRQTNAPLRVVSTNPFFAPALVARAARRRSLTVNLLYDLFPEALIQAGLVDRDSRIARLCAAVTRYALRECAATVFLGERLRAYAEATHGPARRAVVIHVGADGAPFASSPPQPLPHGVRPRVLYSGLMGSMHDIETVAAALRQPNRGGFDWQFQASGSGYAQLRRKASESIDVNWGLPLEESEWRAAMIQAQVALVTISPGAERVVMPSKTYSALVAGQAILAVCRRESDLADLIARHDCGWVVEPGDVAGLRLALEGIAQRPEELLAKRQNAFAAGHRYYEMKRIAIEWLKLFRELGAIESNAARPA